jgi:hypothetical protein
MAFKKQMLDRFNQGGISRGEVITPEKWKRDVLHRKLVSEPDGAT